MKQLRIALTLPGEASLGAFEAGAVCALLIAVQKLNAQSKADAPPPVCVDVISGASSGALTAVLAARILLSGEDPVYPLRRAWVTEPTVESLRGHDGSAPLTLDRARQVARELLAAQLQDSSDVAARTEESPPAQRSSVTLEFALACLRGFTYEIARKDRDPIRATSHIDWARHEFRPGVELGFTEQWSSAVDSAIASASHPVAFPPAVLDRTAERPKYRERQVKDFPESGELWYVDGGLLDREPLGRCLQIAHEADAEHARDGQSERLVLVMRPEPDLPVAADDSDWTDADARPPWTTTLARAFRLVSRHSLYEDLRRVEKTNQRVSWTNELVRVLEPAVSNDAGARRALEQLVRSIERDKDSLGRRRRNSDANGSTPTPAELLKRALHAATGLESKVRVDVGVISAQDPSELAGGKLFQFGGFLAERLRANDFLVGYEAMAVWLLRGLPARGVEPEAATAALQAVSDRAMTIPGWTGGLAVGRRTSLRTRIDVLRVGLRAVGIGLRRGADSPRV